VQDKCETNIYYVNICKYEHENNMTKLWCKIMHKIGVEYAEGNEDSYSYYTHLGTKFKKASKEVSMYTSSNETS
jgi:hypothetical protein